LEEPPADKRQAKEVPKMGKQGLQGKSSALSRIREKKKKSEMGGANGTRKANFQGKKGKNIQGGGVRRSGVKRTAGRHLEAEDQNPQRHSEDKHRR